MTICAKCLRPVDLIEALPDEDADGVEIVFSCHGEKDRIFISRNQFLIRKGSSETLIPDRAFLGPDRQANPGGWRH